MKQMVSILVVDDDPNLRKTLGDILHLKGYQSILTSSGAEAIAAVEHDRVSLALIDLMLPDMNGLDVMERIKAVSPLTEAIILTGHASLETAITATRQGAFSYMLKPYQMDDLLLNIQHGIERQEAREEILRLASYPRLNPNPLIEIGPAGDLTYLNPAAEQAFPDLAAAGLSHPLLYGMAQISATMRSSDQRESIRELVFGDAIYEQHISYIREADLIRIYMLDITLRKQAEESLVTREREQAAVAELGTFALSGTSLTEVFERTAALIAHTLVVELCLVLEVQNSGKLLLQAAGGWQGEAKGQLRDEMDFALLTRLTRNSDEPLFWGATHGNVRPESQTLLVQLGMVSGVSLTIRTASCCFGVLGVFDSSEREFSRDDINFLQAIANVLSAAVQRKRAEEEIHLLATTDSLTGIANRREFTRLLEKEIDRFRRYGTKLSLVMYDIDHFKQVNDNFGHDVGDCILRTLTMLMRENIRTVDVVARWGGEEFMILMPQSDAIAAAEAAEKLREKVVQRRFQQVQQLTISLGVTEFAAGDDLNALLKRVDDALYRAKELGRNRVEVLPEPKNS